MMPHPYEEHLTHLKSPMLFQEGRVLLIGGKSSGKSCLIKRFRDTWETPAHPPQAHDQNGSVRIVCILDLRDYRSQRPDQIWTQLFGSLFRELNSRITGLASMSVSATTGLHATTFGQELDILLARCRCVSVDIVVALKRVHLLEDASWLDQGTAQAFLLSLKGVWDTCHRCRFAWILSGEPRLLEMADNLVRYDVAGSTWIQEAKVCRLYNLGIQQTRRLLEERCKVIDDGTVEWVHQLSGGQIKIVDAIADAFQKAADNHQDFAAPTWQDHAYAELLERLSRTFHIWYNSLSKSALACVDSLHHSEMIKVTRNDRLAAIQCACTGVARYDETAGELSKVNKLFWVWYAGNQSETNLVRTPSTLCAVDSPQERIRRANVPDQIYFDWNHGALYDNENCSGRAIRQINDWRAHVLRLFFTREEDNTIPAVSSEDFETLVKKRLRKDDVDDARKKIANRLGTDLKLNSEALIGKCQSGFYPKGKMLHLKKGQADHVPQRKHFLANPDSFKKLPGYVAL